MYVWIVLLPEKEYAVDLLYLEVQSWMRICLVISENTVHDLLEVLCSIDKTPREHLETQQACFKQFAQILDFVLRFDDTKVSRPLVEEWY